MLMDIPLVADLEAIRGRRQQRIDDNLRRTNKGRVDYNYKVGERVKLKVWDPINWKDDSEDHTKSLRSSPVEQ